MSELGNYKSGKVNISDEVIGVIASIAASEVDGVTNLSGSLSEEMLERIGRKNFQKGIEVQMNNEVVLVTLSIVVGYQKNILKIAQEVQESVKSAIESMTNLEVVAVNVSVVGISK